MDKVFVINFFEMKFLFLFMILFIGCEKKTSPEFDLSSYLTTQQNSSQNNASEGNTSEASTTSSTTTQQNYTLPEIDLNNWKVTLPVGNPSSVRPPEILDYATNETLRPFFYNDSIDGSLVFYTYPGSTTPNSSYSRTELREQMESGSDHVNWTFAQGGTMRGTLSVPDISVNGSGTPHRVIVMQIHGRLTDAQRDLIGEDDNNAPPILKIYWDRGRIRIKTKIVKDLTDSEEELLHTDAWGDDDGVTLPVEVGHDPFTLEVIVTNGRMEVILNDEHSVVYDSVHIQKWGIFENYFKAGNYLQSIDQGAYSYVKYFDLEVSHD